MKLDDLGDLPFWVLAAVVVLLALAVGAAVFWLVSQAVPVLAMPAAVVAGVIACIFAMRRLISTIFYYL